MKFEEAKYIFADNKRLYSVEEVTELRIKNPKEFLRIKNHLYCPECETPHLSHNLCSTRCNYFSTYNGENHKDECLFKCEKASTKLLESFLENEKTLDQLHNRLQNVLTMLFHCDKLEINPLIIRDTNTLNKAISETEIISYKKNYYIPKKRLTNGLTIEDTGIYKLFYGYVKLICKKDTYGYKIYVINPIQSKQDIICSLKLSEKVFRYIGLDEDTKYTYYVSFFSILEQNVSKGKTYYNGKITHSKQFYFTKKL